MLLTSTQSFNSQKGQALLIMVLLMAVVLTVGLSTISRTVTDVKVSEQTDEAVRAFSAAEAGIETALIGGPSNNIYNSNLTGNSSSYNASSVALTQSTAINFPPLEKDSTQTLWLSSPSDFKTGNYAGSNLQILWGNTTGNTVEPALEVSIYYVDRSSGSDIYKVAKFPFDPLNRNNGFCLTGVNNCNPAVIQFRSTNAGDTPIDRVSYAYIAEINLATAGVNHSAGVRWPIFARIRTLYVTNPQVLGVKGSENFPSQGTKIASTGQAGSSSRKVEVVRYYPAPPEFFDYVLYSGGSLSK